MKKDRKSFHRFDVAYKLKLMSGTLFKLTKRKYAFVFVLVKNVFHNFIYPLEQTGKKVCSVVQ